MRAATEGGVDRGLLASPRDQADDAADRLGRIDAAGIDAESRLLVHDSLAESIVNVATENRASLVIVGRPSTPGASPFASTGEAIAAALAAPVAILVGEAEWIREVEVVREPEHLVGSFDADGIAVELARRIGGTSVEVSDIDPEALEELRPGQLRLLPATSWQLLTGAENPPAGSAVLILPDG